MNVIDLKTEIDRLDKLIKLKATGSPKELAKKLGTTERTVYRIIKQLKEMGCPIFYDKARESYCYEKQGELTFKFTSQNPNNKAIDKIEGGYFIKS
jgi:biotin operon repressor